MAVETTDLWRPVQTTTERAASSVNSPAKTDSRRSTRRGISPSDAYFPSSAVSTSVVGDTKALPSPTPYRGSDGVDQLGTPKRLVEKSNSPSAKSTLPHLVIAMSRQDHRRNVPTHFPQTRQ
jgi:hypothetical protein